MAADAALAADAAPEGGAVEQQAPRRQGYNVVCNRNGETYSLSYGRGGKRLSATVARSRGAWIVSSGLGRGQIADAALREVKRRWGEAARLAYHGLADNGARPGDVSDDAAGDTYLSEAQTQTPEPEPEPEPEPVEKFRDTITFSDATSLRRLLSLYGPDNLKRWVDAPPHPLMIA